MKKSVPQILICFLCLAFFAAPAFSSEFSSSLISSDVNDDAYFDVSRHMQDSPDSGIRNRGSESNIGEEHALYAQGGTSAMDEDDDDDYLEDEGEEDKIADPIEGFNRVMYHVNDKLYFWFLRPVSKGYGFIVPEKVRVGIRNMFNNLAAPIRVANNLLQFKGREALSEVGRFGANTVFGIAGFYDVAKNNMKMPVYDEDFGQTLGKWGLGPGFYITWPVLGPSSLRDTFGFAGDYFLDPVNYVKPPIDQYAIKGGDKINRTSLVIGDYEDIKKDAIDPYTAIRDIYHQYRKSKIDR